MKLFQAVIILFVLLKESHPQNNTLENESTTTQKENQSHIEESTKPMGVTKTDYRRVRSRDFSQILAKKLQQQTKSYYEPYWEGGENVFLRTTKYVKKWMTSQHYNKTIYTTELYTTDFTGKDMSRNRDCNRDCPILYSYNYGRVCGYRYNTHKWTVEFMEFENICTLEQENCKFGEKRPSKLFIITIQFSRNYISARFHIEL